jgi:hypothetical protein
VVGWICGACFVDITFFLLHPPRLLFSLLYMMHTNPPSRPANTPPLVYPHIICISVPAYPSFHRASIFPFLFFFSFHLHRDPSTTCLVTTNPSLLRFSTTTHNFFPLFFFSLHRYYQCLFSVARTLKSGVDILATGGEMAYLMINS